MSRRWTTLLFVFVCVLKANSSHAQIYPCYLFESGCAPELPFFIIILDGEPARPEVRQETCGTAISSCLGLAFSDKTARITESLMLTELRNEIVNQPIPTAASGFNIVFRRGSRTFSRPNKSFGPTFAEPATTQSKGTIGLGYFAQFRSYGGIVGQQSSSARVSYLHDGVPVWNQETSIALNQFVVTAFATVGLTDHIDVSVVVPGINSSLEGHLQHGWAGREPHRNIEFSGEGLALGDIILSSKATFGSDSSRWGFAGYFHLPTGSEEKLTGIDVLRTRVAAIWSGLGTRAIQPHANFGATFFAHERKTTDDDGQQPFDLYSPQINIAAGVDFVVSPRVTLTVDALARRTVNSAHVVYGRRRSLPVLRYLLDGQLQCCIDNEDVFYAVVGDVTKGVVAIGGKVNVDRSMLLNVNVTLPFGTYAIRPRPTVTAGFTIQL